MIETPTVEHRSNAERRREVVAEFRLHVKRELGVQGRSREVEGDSLEVSGSDDCVVSSFSLVLITLDPHQTLGVRRERDLEVGLQCLSWDEVSSQNGGLFFASDQDRKQSVALERLELQSVASDTNELRSQRHTSHIERDIVSEDISSKTTPPHISLLLEFFESTANWVVEWREGLLISGCVAVDRRQIRISRSLELRREFEGLSVSPCSTF